MEEVKFNSTRRPPHTTLFSNVPQPVVPVSLSETERAVLVEKLKPIILAEKITHFSKAIISAKEFAGETLLGICIEYRDPELFRLLLVCAYGPGSYVYERKYAWAKESKTKVPETPAEINTAISEIIADRSTCENPAPSYYIVANKALDEAEKIEFLRVFIQVSPKSLRHVQHGACDKIPRHLGDPFLTVAGYGTREMLNCLLRFNVFTRRAVIKYKDLDGNDSLLDIAVKEKNRDMIKYLSEIETQVTAQEAMKRVRQEHIEKIQVVLKATPATADQETLASVENTVKTMLDEFKSAITQKEKELDSTFDADFYSTVAGQYLSLTENVAFRCLCFYQNAALAYRAALNWNQNFDEKLYDELFEKVYRKFFSMSTSLPCLFRESWYVDLGNFLQGAEKDLSGRCNDSRAGLLGRVLEGQAELAGLEGRESDAKGYYKKAAEAYVRAIRTCSGKERVEWCKKYIHALKNSFLSQEITAETRKLQLINFLDNLSCNTVFIPEAAELINQFAENVFKAFASNSDSSLNPNPGALFYVELLSLILEKHNEFNKLELIISELCSAENKESYKLTLETAKALLSSVLRISQQQDVPPNSFFDRCRSAENNAILQRCVQWVTNTLAELPSRKLETELRSEISELKQKVLVLETQVASLLKLLSPDAGVPRNTRISFTQ